MIPFGEYLPDQPLFQNPGATVALNVVPLTTQSYGPFATLLPYTAAMATRCKGAITAKDVDGDISYFAGIAAAINHLKSDQTWEDYSKSGGYALGAEDFWYFLQYGNRIVAVSNSNPIQTFLLGTDIIFSDLSATAPQAAYASIIRDFLMVGNTYFSGDTVPNMVWWSAIDDPTSWPAVGSTAAIEVQSDNQQLPEGGAVQGIVGSIGGADGAVFMEEAIYRITYVGSPVIFQFDRVEKQHGTRIPGSIVNVGNFAFYLGVDGFYAFDGTNSTPIGAQKVDKSFYKDFDQNNFFNVVSAADVINKQVMWAYPGVGNSNGVPNKMLVYNWITNRWTLVEQEIEYFFRAYTQGYTLDQLDAFGTIDTLPYSLDSRIWAGGTILLSGFDSAHKLGNFAGDNLAATIETADIDSQGGQRVFVSGIRPIVDTSGVTAAVGYRDNLSDPVSYTTPTSPGSDAYCPQRISRRFVRAQVNIAAAASWTHAQGIETIQQPAGER